MAGVERFELSNAGIKILCLNQLGYTPIKFLIIWLYLNILYIFHQYVVYI